MLTRKGYGEALLGRRVIHLVDEEGSAGIGTKMVQSFRSQLAAIAKDGIEGDLVISLSTQGGKIRDGFILHNEIKLLADARPTYLVCSSYVASMGIVLLAAIPSERRFAFPNTCFYMHRCNFARNVQESGFLENHEYAALEYGAINEVFKRDEHAILRLISRGTGMSVKEVRAHFANPRYVYEREAKRLGLIAGILK